eukprot:jgi/Ulvmu1/12178/UM085_0042.1
MRWHALLSRRTSITSQLVTAFQKPADASVQRAVNRLRADAFRTHRGYKGAFETSPPRRYAIVHHKSQGKSLLEEAQSLVLTAFGQQAQSITVGGAQELVLRGGAALRKGHIARIREFVQAQRITDVVLNFNASGSHLSRIAHALQLPEHRGGPAPEPVVVKCRTAVVLDIFRKHASTAEARLQVQLAELRYKAARVVRRRDAQGRMVFGMAGHEAEVVSARGRGGQGAVGGSGETELTVQASRMRAEVARLQQQLAGVRRRRQLLRDSRQRRGHVTVALVGYTNAGKSSLMSALCHEDVGAADRLFATLDTKISRADIGAGEGVLVVDTVGFIQGLPLNLVAAFQATLDEATQASLLLHVVDAASDDALQQRQTVRHTLRQLGMSERDLRCRVLEVWSKADRLQLPAATPSQAHNRPRHPSAGSADPPGNAHSAGMELTQDALWKAVCERIKASHARGKREVRAATEDLDAQPAQVFSVQRPKQAVEKDSSRPAGEDPMSMGDAGQHHAQRGKRILVAQLHEPLNAHELEPESIASVDADVEIDGEHKGQGAVGVEGKRADVDMVQQDRLAELLMPVTVEAEAGEEGMMPEAQAEQRDGEGASEAGAGDDESENVARVRVPVVVSAVTGMGLGRLKQAIHGRLALLKRSGLWS